MKNPIGSWVIPLALMALSGHGANQVCLAGTPETDASTDPLRISFKTLARFPVTNAILNAKQGKVLKHLPKSVLDLDGKRVTLCGFMLPTKVHRRMVTEFMLMRTQGSCCFGIPPELNEVVEVRNLREPVPILMDTPVRVVGRLHVKDRWEGTFLFSIYQLDLESVGKEFGKVD